MLERMTARVGVVVRTKDRPEFLERALTDIAAQSFSDVEIVVVNDGGDEETVNRVVARSAVAGRATVITTRAPGGRCVAANEGLNAISAAYVALHDDDDFWHPDFLKRTTALLDASPDDAGVMVATEIVYEERRGKKWVEVSRAPYWAGMTAVTFTSLLDINRAVPISFLYRRELHDEVGFYDETLTAVEDWDFYLRVTARHPVAFLGGTPLAYWTQRPTAKGADGNSMFELSAEHDRDDLVVRDRALRAWVAENGAGLPLYIGLVEKRLREALESRDSDIVDQFYRRHPVWRAVNALRHRLRRGRSSS